MPNSGINAPQSTHSGMDKNGHGSQGVYSSSRKRAQSVLTAEEVRQINEESQHLGKRQGFSPAAIVDISKNAKKLWQEALEKRGGMMKIAKPYFSSRMLEKMKEAGQLGEGGMVSLAYKKMIDIFV